MRCCLNRDDHEARGALRDLRFYDRCMPCILGETFVLVSGYILPTVRKVKITVIMRYYQYSLFHVTEFGKLVAMGHFLEYRILIHRP